MKDVNIKVAMLGHKVVPSRRGGIENVLTSLCPLLVRLGAEVTCYNRSSDAVENEYIGTVTNKQFRGVRLKTAPTLKIRGIAAMLASYTAAVRAAFGQYDIVHFHAEGPCAAMWIPKLFGKTCIATVHGLDWQREKWGKGFASRYIRLGEKTLAACADEMIVLSESAYDYFNTTYHRKAVIIPNGIDRPACRAAKQITKLYGLHAEDYICVISRLTAEKGIHYLIDAYNMVRPKQKLVIAGDTSDTDDYVTLLKEKAADNPNIIFTGFISGEVLEEMYSNAYAVCLPSDLEGMSISLLEALAYKNTLLCSDIPENTAVAEDKAIYFKKGDVLDLADKLQKICENKSLAESVKTDADTFILSKYSWNDTARATYTIYENILRNTIQEGKIEL